MLKNSSLEKNIFDLQSDLSADERKRFGNYILIDTLGVIGIRF